MIVTSTLPVPPGTVVVMLVSLFTVKVAGVLPKLTALAPVKRVPVTITEVPVNPAFGLRPVIAAADGTV
jgi:hypothetical protein